MNPRHGPGTTATAKAKTPIRKKQMQRKKP
jgi:hypothetical protein